MKILRTILVVLALLPLDALAGDYDGVWLRNNGTDNVYRVWYSTGSTWVSVAVIPTTGLYGTWSTTSIGTISGNTITGTYDGITSSGSFTITLSSLTSGQVIYKSCTLKAGASATSCPTLNTVYTLSKIL